MRYWNKSKKYRDRQWHVVNLASAPPWRSPGIKKWCQDQSSTGRFYWSLYTNTWYFELEKDAVWFILNWS